MFALERVRVGDGRMWKFGNVKMWKCDALSTRTAEAEPVEARSVPKGAIAKRACARPFGRMF